MKRMKILFGQRRVMVIATLAILVLAAAALVASSASFTAQTANAGNVFTTGALTMSNDKAPGAILTLPGMKPGDSVSGTVKLQNTGTVDGVFSLTKTISAHAEGTGGGVLANKLDLTIKEGSTTLWTGKLGAAVGTPLPGVFPLSLGTWTVGSTAHTYTFTVKWPNDEATSGVDNTFVGSSCTALFQWDAVSVVAP
jgi:spore coat-associated protein N